MPTDYPILALDGGGIRGIITAVLLEKITHQLPHFLDQVQLIAGSSSGGLIALGLAKGLSPSEIVSFFRTEGRQIFGSDLGRKVAGMNGAMLAKHSGAQLKRSVRKAVGSGTLGELKKRVLIPTFRLNKKGATLKDRMWAPKFFHNFPGEDADISELIVDVAVRTCSEPYFLPVYQGYVGGGTVANNPSMCALAQAIDEKTGKQELQNLSILSISTGQNPISIPGSDHDWGFVQWTSPLKKVPILHLLLEGGMGVDHYQCQRLLHERYHRLDPLLQEDISLDDAGKIDELEALARSMDVTPTVEWIQEWMGARKPVRKVA